MTMRKPPSVTFPDWVEQQIRTAEAAGAFENLPGAGKPIPGIDRTPHELEWVANYLRRQDADVTGLLPPALALAKEVEDLPVRLLGERTERGVRSVVDDLNARIDKAWAAPQTGLPFRVRRVRVDEVVEQWRETRAELAARRAEAAAQRARPEPEPPRGRWLRLRRRDRVSG